MGKKKKIAIISIGLIVVISVIAGYYISGNWMIRYKAGMNKFFGKGNWECYSESIRKRTPDLSEGDKAYKYKVWDIYYNNRKGEEESASISEDYLKRNHARYSFFSPERINSKQAFYSELVWIAFDITREQLYNEIIKDEFSEKEAYSIDALVYFKGLPKPEFYETLAKEEWFTINKITVEKFLSCGLHDFYINIRLNNYDFEKLSNQEQKNILKSVNKIENKLLNKYGDKASFVIFFDDENRVEYIDGVKQKARE